MQQKSDMQRLKKKKDRTYRCVYRVFRSGLHFKWHYSVRNNINSFSGSVAVFTASEHKFWELAQYVLGVTVQRHVTGRNGGKCLCVAFAV